MSLSDLPRGYDAWKLRGPDERDYEAELEARNMSYDRAYDEARDEEGEPKERDFIMERAQDEAMREDAGELRRELARADAEARKR